MLGNEKREKLKEREKGTVQEPGSRAGPGGDSKITSVQPGRGEMSSQTDAAGGDMWGARIWGIPEGSPAPPLRTQLRPCVPSPQGTPN